MSLVGTAQHFRFRNDNGSETGATWMAPEDTEAILSLTTGENKNFRLRWCFDGAVPPEGDDTEIIFSVSHNGGPPVGIGSTTSPLQGVVSTWITQGEYTTNQLTVPPGDTYQSIQGCTSNVIAQSPGLLFETGIAIECEVAFVAIADALAANDTLDFTWAGFIFGAGEWGQYSGNVRLQIAFGSPFPLLTNSRIPNIGFR